MMTDKEYLDAKIYNLQSAALKFALVGALVQVREVESEINACKEELKKLDTNYSLCYINLESAGLAVPLEIIKVICEITKCNEYVAKRILNGEIAVTEKEFNALNSSYLSNLRIKFYKVA